MAAFGRQLIDMNAAVVHMKTSREIRERLGKPGVIESPLRKPAIDFEFQRFFGG